MKAADAMLDPGDEFGRLAAADVQGFKITPVSDIDQAAAENDAAVLKHAAPEIRQVNGIKRATEAESEGLELSGCERHGGNSESQFGLSVPDKSVQLERESICGNNGAGSANFPSLNGQYKRTGRANAFYRSVFDDANAGTFRRAGETGYEPAGIESASREFGSYAKIAGILPGDGRIRKRIGAADFPSTGQVQVTVDDQVAEYG